MFGPFNFDEFYYGVVVVVVELDGATGDVTGDGVVVVVEFVVVVLGGVQPAKATIAREQTTRAMSFECFIKREIKK